MSPLTSLPADSVAPPLLSGVYPAHAKPTNGMLDLQRMLAAVPKLTALLSTARQVYLVREHVQ